MGYLNENGLARYDGLIKQWVTFQSGTVDGVDPLLNWQKTTDAGAVTFYPLPAAPIDPTVNFAFTETGPASGTKSPDNPSTITGVSQVKVSRCGKNLLPFPYDSSSGTTNGITLTVDSDGSITANGTATASVAFSIVMAQHNDIVKSGLTYTMSGCPSGGSTSTYCIRFGDSSGASDTGGGKTFVADSGIAGKAIWILITSGTSVSNLVFKPQLELGSAATAFEPYEGADYTIDLGGTYYGGSVDLSTGVMTVTHYIFEMNGTEWWTSVNNDGETLAAYNSETGLGYSYCIPRNSMGGLRATDLNSTCTHFPVNSSGISENTVQNGTTATPSFCLVGNGDQFRVAFPFSTLTAWKQWLAGQKTAGTPVKATVKLATPYTVQLTPTQIYSLSQPDPYSPRLNTVYSDQISMNVGYPKSPLAASTELTNAIVSLGGNI